MIHKGEITTLCEPNSVVSDISPATTRSFQAPPLTNIINVGLLELDSTLIIVAALIATLCLLVDRKVGFELSVRFQVTRLIRGVFMDDVCSLILELSEREEDDIAGGDPDL